MQLPDDVLAIIREYSKPLTRPDWRTVCPLSGHLFYASLNYDLCVKNHNSVFNYVVVNSINLYKQVFNNLLKTEWGQMYMVVRIFGIYYASCKYDLPILQIYKMPGMLHAHEYYVKVNRHNN